MPAPSGRGQRTIPLATMYLLLMVAAVAGFWMIERYGRTLAAPAAVESTVPTAKMSHSVAVGFHVLATLAAIIFVGRGLAILLAGIGQPAVIGEVVAGILLGPSLLGRVWPEAMHFFIPSAADDPQGQVVVALKTIAQLGVVVYMFLVGLELNPKKVGRNAHAALAISHASIVLPFLLGAGLALWLYPRVSSSDVSFTSFALFMGAAMSITAFPILARILTDRRLEHTDLGIIALSCAAVDDVTAWCLLAFVVGVAKSEIGSAVIICAEATAFILAMLFLVRPIAQRAVRWLEQRQAERTAIPLVLMAVLVAACITDAIGIHAVFGAFLMGVVLPHDSRLATEIGARFRDLTTQLLLPAFFAVTGMNTQIQLIQGWESWWMCLVIIAIATLGKFGGTILAARVAGVDWRTSAALGILMNTRGLMELIVLNIGLALGVISPTLFAMMVLMALATTMATAPILKILVSRGEEPLPAEQVAVE